MKKFIIMMLLSYLSPLYAEIYFYDTVPDQVVTEFTRENVKYKPVITYNVFKNQVYYVYVSSEESTIINTESPIQNIVISAPELINVGPENVEGKKFFSIRPAGKLDNFFETTMQIICEDYIAIIQLVLTPYKKQANNIVNLQDGNSKKNMQIYTRDKFIEQQKIFDQSIEKREKLMSFLLFNEGQFYPINQVIDIKQSKLELTNISIVDNKYMFNIEFIGSDPIKLHREKIFSYITSYKQIVLNEKKGERNLYYPEDILLYRNGAGNQCATILFSVDASDKTTYFYTDLYLSESIFFSAKVNLDLISSFENNLFEVETK